MNKKYYRHYNFYDIDTDKNFDKNGLILLKNFPAYQQTTEYTCGPACALMCLKYFGIEISEMEIAKDMHTRPFPYGTKLKDFVEYFRKIGGVTTISSLDYNRDKSNLIFPEFKQFKEFVKTNLKEGNPIIVENVDYGGHYKVIIGYDDLGVEEEDMLIFADPYDRSDGKIDGYNYFPADRFFYMWFDDHCLEKKYRKQPFCVISKKKTK